jgi:hypothetical protein
MMFHFHPKWRRPVVLTLSLIAIGLSTARIALAIADMYRIDELPLTPAVVGQLDPILGLISTSGLSPELRRTLLNGGFVEITPTVDDAARALLAWIKHLDHWIEKNRHPNTDNAVIVSSYLRSRKEIDDLIVAQRKSHDKYVQIGAWNVDCEDSRWWREVGLGGKSWADIEGRFVIDDNGQFEIVVVGAYLLFVNGRGDSKTIQSTPFVTSTH